MKSNQNISFRLHGYIFCTAENSLIGHNLTRDVWRVKFKDCSRSHLLKSHWSGFESCCKLQPATIYWSLKRKVEGLRTLCRSKSERLHQAVWLWKGVGSDGCSIPGNRRRYLPDLMQSTSTSLSASSLSSVSLDSEWESGIDTKDRIFSCASWVRCDSVDAEKEAETSSDNRRRAEEPVQPEQQQQRSRADGAHQPTETAGKRNTLSSCDTSVNCLFLLCASVSSLHGHVCAPNLPKNPWSWTKQGHWPPACDLCMYTVRLFSVLGRKSGGRKRREVRCSS